MNTLFLGKKIIKLNTVPSTNNYALDLLKNEQVVEGTIIIARHQTAGRGQRDKIWTSQPGMNLLCSIVLRPVFLEIHQQFQLNKVIALAVLNALQQYVPSFSLQIKWPNDIIAGDRKLAGLLLENTIKGRQIVSCVAGIGVNLNQDVFPKESGKPVSLKALSGKSFGDSDILEAIVGYLEPFYLRLKSGRFEEFDREFNRKLWYMDKVISFEWRGNTRCGRLLSVNASGLLCVELESGELQEFRSGEIRWLI